MRKFYLLKNVTATGSGPSGEVPQDARLSVQAIGSTTSGAGSATVLVEGSNNDANWLTIMMITLELSTSASSDGAAEEVPWLYVRATLASISGTGATVDVIMVTV